LKKLFEEEFWQDILELKILIETEVYAKWLALLTDKKVQRTT
jgi:hypothetical protein